MPSRLVRWLPAALAPVVVAGAVAVPLVAAAAPPALPDRTPQQVLELVAKAKSIDGFSGTVQQQSELGLPELPSTGAGSDSDTASSLELITGDHTARVWVAGTTRSRVAVLDDMAERDAVRDGRSVWLWDSKKNTAVHVTVSGSSSSTGSEGTTRTPAEVADALLAEVGPTTATTVDTTQRVAGRDAYTLVLTPKTSATTVGSVQLAVDAATGLPLQVEVFARGASSPAFQTGFTSIDYTVPAASTFAFAPPADATVTTKTITAPAKRSTRSSSGLGADVTGSGWDAVVEIPAGKVPASLDSNPTYLRLTTAVSGGRVLSTSLVNVLRTDDGRVLAGAVPVSRLQAVAAG